MFIYETKHKLHQKQPSFLLNGVTIPKWRFKHWTTLWADPIKKISSVKNCYDSFKHSDWPKNVQPIRMLKYEFTINLHRTHAVWWLRVCNFKKLSHSRLFFFIFIFSIQLKVIIFLRMTGFWCWKLYQPTEPQPNLRVFVIVTKCKWHFNR